MSSTYQILLMVILIFVIAFAISSAQGKSPAYAAQVAGISVAALFGLMLLGKVFMG